MSSMTESSTQCKRLVVIGEFHEILDLLLGMRLNCTRLQFIPNLIPVTAHFYCHPDEDTRPVWVGVRASKGSKFIWFFNVTRDNLTRKFTTAVRELECRSVFSQHCTALI